MCSFPQDGLHTLWGSSDFAVKIWCFPLFQIKIKYLTIPSPLSVLYHVYCLPQRHQLSYMPYMSRSSQNLWRRIIFSHTFTEFCFLHRSPYMCCSWRQPYQLFPRSFLVLGTRDLISTSYHINTVGWLFRSCCQHTAGIPSVPAPSAGWRSLHRSENHAE